MTACLVLVAWLTSVTAGPLLSSPSALVEAFVHAWNTHDAPAFGRLYADDADWVVAGGERLKGRKAIEGALAKEHLSWARTTEIRATDVTVRELDRDRSIVMYRWEVTSNAAPGARRGNTVLIVTKNADGWVIVSGQVAALTVQSANVARDREEITSILGRWEMAWQAHDMASFASLFHEDGVWVLWTGEVWMGRRVIEEGHAAVHKTVFRNSIQRENLEEITFVGPDAAIMRFCSVLTGDERAPNEVIRSRKFVVVTRRQGTWKVRWGQNTRLASSVPDSDCFVQLRKRGD